MSQLALPNDKPGECCKCRGTGIYRWGRIVNGPPSKSGTCFACNGTGRQSRRQIRRNQNYNALAHRRRPFA
jgi:hypothetical protein